VIYYDEANEFVRLNSELIRETKRRRIKIILLIVKTLEQNHMLKQSYLVRHNAVLTIRLAAGLSKYF
jgi:hypothetical protein